MAPQPSLGNRLYLYQLLSRELGQGRQTFLPRVEEVLAADGIDPYDLEAESVLDLLETLGSFVKLTAFKGGRVYATIQRVEEWDALLDKASEMETGKTGKAKAGGKSWKRSKKTARPVKPKHRKRPEEAAGPAVPAPAEKAAEGLAEQVIEGAAPTSVEHTTATPEADPVERNAAASEPANSFASIASADDETGVASEPDHRGEQIEGTDGPSAEAVPSPAGASARTAPEPEPEPSISFTITYDPSADPDRQEAETAAAECPSDAQTDQSTAPSTEPVSAARPSEPAQPQVPAAAAPPAPDTKVVHGRQPIDAAPPVGFPVDLATDVYCPANLLAKLSHLLPLGADVLGIANEYYHIALERGTLERGRSWAEFPLRYTADGERRTALVHIKRRTVASGLPWGIEAVRFEAPENQPR